MRGLWGEGKFCYAGEHFSVAEVDGKPAPVSDIPILIGGGGQKVLSLAAQKADIVGINPKIVARSINPKSMATAAADVVDQKVGWVKEAAGDRIDDIELQLQVFVTKVTDDPMAFAEQLAPAFGLPPEVVLQAPYFQIGTVDQIAHNLAGSPRSVGHQLHRVPAGRHGGDGLGGGQARRHLSELTRLRPLGAA